MRCIDECRDVEDWGIPKEQSADQKKRGTVNRDFNNQQQHGQYQEQDQDAQGLNFHTLE